MNGANNNEPLVDALQLHSTNFSHEQQEDRLSSLPDSLLVSIVSLLPIKTAVTTSVLSHRRRHVWTQVSDISLSFKRLTTRRDATFRAFISTVDHICEQLTSSKIYRFRLKFSFGCEFQFDKLLLLEHRDSTFEACFRLICALNVEQISISSDKKTESRSYGKGVKLPLFVLPACALQCQSLVVLKLAEILRFQLPEDGVILPNLKKLELFSIVQWDCETMSTLFKSCPVLEELNFGILGNQDRQFIDVSCPNLRIMNSIIYTPNADDMSLPWSIVIDAPRLEMIKLSCWVSIGVSFVTNPCLLSDVRIIWGNDVNASVDYHGQLSEFIRSVCSITSLEITSNFSTSPIHSSGTIQPILVNLTHLKVWMFKSFDLRLLHYTPNLKALVIERDYCESVEWGMPDTIPSCLSNKLMKIEVNIIKALYHHEVEFFKYILCNAAVLKKLRVYFPCFSTEHLGNLSIVWRELFRCPRSSSTCVIVFSSGCLRASNEELDGKLDYHINFSD